MKKAWGVLVMLLVLFLEKVGAEVRYCPVVFACEDNSGVGVWLMGGFGEGKWYEHTALPILVDGQAVTPEEGIEPDEPVVCTTPLVHEGTRLVFYSIEGQKVGSQTVKRTQYFYNPASSETFIGVETVEAELEMPSSAMLGVGDGWDAVIAPTRRKTEKENVAFTLDSLPLSVTFSPTFDEYGEKFYEGTLISGVQRFLLTNAYVEEEKELKGFFIDLNGDGHVEFVLYVQNRGGFVRVFELNLDGAFVKAQGDRAGEETRQPNRQKRKKRKKQFVPYRPSAVRCPPQDPPTEILSLDLGD